MTDTAKIKSYRTLVGLTQQEMAKQLGMSKVSYQLKENGEREFTRSEMIDFVKIVQTVDMTITMDDIFMS